ncbi:hypothetical protein LQ564_13145 [Massilia sp. G4R7]|uniref:Uncharacterized protein n=1 Tax=Massilia phyllostachyos TaxID=2898585 RepID=A0ABS8Q6N5_9BURK|nr:hypothetical protein [Massilia phyllostachyos]MCD2517254.1 hypothetical protein [Massilia phyllostachyos]
MSRKKHAAHRQARPGAVQGSRARKQCEALGARLSAVDADMLAWEAASEKASELYRSSLIPLDESVRRGLRELVLLLDRMHAEAALDDEEREILSDILANMAAGLLDADAQDEEADDDIVIDDPELAAIYERHRDDEVEPVTAFEQLVVQVQGIDLDRLPTRESLRVVVAAEAETALAQLARTADKFEQLAARRHANLVQLQQAEDALAAELTAALHGAQAMDETTRLAHLRRIDAARARTTLADLLAVGFELEQGGFIGHFSEKRITGYKQLLNEVLQLTEQEFIVGKGLILAELELEVEPEQVPALTAADLLAMMGIMADTLRKELAEVERDLVELRDPRQLKTWLRTASVREAW